jgi:2-polyprenyl-6-methoxyphenol hydroxylase-like FAD-dependent oxidoreductase
VPVADFTRLPTRCRFVAFMPQWDFLDFLAAVGLDWPAFRLRMRAEVTGLVEEAGRVVGVLAETADGPLEVRADLVVAADGRASRVRDAAGLAVRELGAPMDVLWFRLSRRPTDSMETMGRFDAGRILVMIDRGEYWQCGYVIPKGAGERTRQAGLDVFRTQVAALAPIVADRVGELRAWEDVKLLTVRVNRARCWYRRGLLCIGDAAHAMSPVGGVGVNLAVQDAVATANLLASPLREGRLTVGHLRRVQRRRELPTRVTQRLQLLMQRRVIRRVLAGSSPLAVPLPLRLLARSPGLRRLPGRLIGLGIRPEHVRTPAVAGPT